MLTIVNHCGHWTIGLCEIILVIDLDKVTMKCTLKLSCWTLFMVDMDILPSLCHWAPLIRLQCLALYKFVLTD